MCTSNYVIPIQVDSFDYRFPETECLYCAVHRTDVLCDRLIHGVFHQANFNASVGTLDGMW